ncbi:hypothetical protein BASA81_001183 [Batrachochytrium salamandrivorans]|nr:hypothetical protein BASA81_001183 [Batrachochytrium salamandrivorans]
MSGKRHLLFNRRNLALSAVSLALPTAFYVNLVDSRLKRRLPVVLRDELPPALAEPPRFGIHPKLNYVEGWFADVPKKWFCKRPYMEEFARVFWLQNSLLNLEASFLGTLDMVGIHPYEKRGDRNCKNKVVEGKEVVDGIFHVERATQERVDCSFWFTTPDRLIGGVHTLAVDETAPQDKRYVRVWFVSHFSLNVPVDKLESGPRVSALKDPAIPQANESYFPALLWFHRLYASLVLPPPHAPKADPASACSLSYFKVFVYTLFPPAFFLLALLLIPFPPKVAKVVIRLCDSFLFWQPHPAVPLSLFWCVVTVSAVTFLLHMDNLNKLHNDYRGGERHVNTGSVVEDRSRVLIKLLAEERNCWICGCNLMLWVGVHRYRNLLKAYYRSQDEKSAVIVEKQRVLHLFSQSQSDHAQAAADRAASNVARGGGLDVEEEEVEPKPVQVKKQE